MTRMQSRRGRAAIIYPESDGKPMAETQVHGAEMVRLTETLRDAFEHDPNVYVWMNMLMYYEEGNPRASVSPDVFMVRGVPKEPPRRTYRIWEEGVPPTVVIEVTSPSTARADQVTKRTLYARLGVAEYILYDPLGEYLQPPLQGYRLDAGEYRAMAAEAEGALVSEALGMRLVLIDGRLRLFDGRTGAPLLDPSERLAVEAEARRRAEARITELEARLRREDAP